jgi:hypothetical protein
MAERGMGLPGATAGRLATVATMPITTDGIELYIQGMLQAATAANSGQRIACPCRFGRVSPVVVHGESPTSAKQRFSLDGPKALLIALRLCKRLHEENTTLLTSRHRGIQAP